MARRFLKIFNNIISVFLGLCLFLGGAYSVYALWDNKQVYAAAENVQADMIKLKPAISEEEEGASFEELLAINPDVRAWVSLDNTKIDFPILQGEDLLSYINTDVYGNFALAGSIFMDTSNDSAFNDAYTLIYGHHMDDHQMFGDLDLYKDKTFFDENTTGMLILPDRVYSLEIIACLLVPASQDEIFDPTNWQTDIDGLLDFTESNSLHVHQDLIREMHGADNQQILALSTCSSEYTDARTIVLARMVPFAKTQVGE